MSPMDYESALIEFLAQRENVGLVFDIAERIEQVKENLLLKFWKNLAIKARDKLGAATGWDTSLDPGKTLLNAKQYGGFYIKPSPEPPRYLCVGISQDDRFIVHYGIVWSEETKKSPDLGEINTLRKKLEEMEYEIDRWTEWWLGVKRTTWCLREKQACVRISGEGSLEEELATSLVELFKTVRTGLERANQALANVSPKRR